MNTNVYWHIAGTTLMNGAPLPTAGESLPELSRVAPYSRGYHANTSALCALDYARGVNVALVSVGGHLPCGEGGVVARTRTVILGYVNAEDILREAGRLYALRVVHLWDCHQEVREYLLSGSGREAAVAAVQKDTRDPSRDPARDAAWRAAWAACRAESHLAARDAAEAAASAVAYVAARDTWADDAWSEARDAARGAAWNAARAEARAAQNADLTDKLLLVLRS